MTGVQTCALPIFFSLAALLLAMSMSLTFTSCGINEADYNSAKEKNSKLESQLEDSKDELEKSKSDLIALQSDYDSLKSEFDKYKEKMKPFEEMEAAKNKKKKAEAEAAQKESQNQTAATDAVSIAYPNTPISIYKTETISYIFTLLFMLYLHGLSILSKPADSLQKIMSFGN